MSDWFYKMPEHRPTSISPAPYRPSVFWSLLWIAVTALGAVAFVFGLAWIVLSPLMPPVGMS